LDDRNVSQGVNSLQRRAFPFRNPLARDLQ
jgi:hypothetical protein